MDEVSGGPVFLPRRRAVVLVVLGALFRVATRRVQARGGAPIPHSAGPQRTVFVFAGVEVATALLVARVIPPAWSVPHLVLEVVAVGVYVGLGFAWRTTPHELREDVLLIRTAVLGDLAVPLSAVAAVRVENRTSPGFGTRHVDDGTIACSVTSHTNVTITLDRPREFTFRKGEKREITQIRFNADEPADAVQEISKVLAHPR
ncbi:hypothetical protein [Actinokineospora spheciospongiae]|uniref:hypothetical protein n=1 Tax=Actinokineospora spheciospongiae TaxID=909613 RepID=UPI0011B450D9|nr:hypothetical protein [Actinokineospora spheciospongiae]